LIRAAGNVTAGLQIAKHYPIMKFSLQGLSGLFPGAPKALIRTRTCSTSRRCRGNTALSNTLLDWKFCELEMNIPHGLALTTAHLTTPGTAVAICRFCKNLCAIPRTSRIIDTTPGIAVGRSFQYTFSLNSAARAAF
jgi:hypothetical protein